MLRVGRCTRGGVTRSPIRANTVSTSAASDRLLQGEDVVEVVVVA